MALSRVPSSAVFTAFSIARGPCTPPLPQYQLSSVSKISRAIPISSSSPASLPAPSSSCPPSSPTLRAHSSSDSLINHYHQSPISHRLKDGSIYPSSMNVRSPLSLQSASQLVCSPSLPSSFSSIHRHFNQNQQKRFFGAGDLKIVAARMKSVKSIQKITKAMKMVAASKLKADQRRLDNGLPFALPVQRLFKRLEIPPKGSEPNTTTAIIPLSSDKGLCGGVNSFVAKQCRQAIAECEKNNEKVKIFGVGEKIRAALVRIFGDRFDRVLNDVAKVPFNYSMAAVIVERIIQAAPDRIILIHNHFKTVISYDTLSVDLLTAKQAKKMEKRELDGFEFEPERSDVWADLHDFYLSCSLYGAMLDNIASEQSARMSAMENASTNAGEMISNLTLKYNRARQAKITTELIEIISGANAV